MIGGAGGDSGGWKKIEKLLLEKEYPPLLLLLHLLLCRPSVLELPLKAGRPPLNPASGGDQYVGFAFLDS
jgi:hypothetical protein